jgi:molybdopterin-guanine dinucleotide biosynthesis protein A
MPALPPSAVAALAATTAAALAASYWAHKSRRRHEARLAMLEALVRQQRTQLREREAQLRTLEQNSTSGLPVAESLYRVVLTGGPCGGKTTALANLKERLEV